MMIRKGLLLSCLVVAGLVFVGFTPHTYAATQKKDLVDDTAFECSGKVVGNVSVKKVGSDVLVKVKITKGTPNTTRTIFWVRQSGTTCHTAFGHMLIGTITTDSHGRGSFKYKGPAPIDGNIHFNIIANGNYYAGIFSAPSTDTTEISEDVRALKYGIPK